QLVAPPVVQFSCALLQVTLAAVKSLGLGQEGVSFILKLSIEISAAKPPTVGDAVNRILIVSSANAAKLKISSFHGALSEVCCCPTMVFSTVQVLPLETSTLSCPISVPYM